MESNPHDNFVMSAPDVIDPGQMESPTTEVAVAPAALTLEDLHALRCDSERDVARFFSQTGDMSLAFFCSKDYRPEKFYWRHVDLATLLLLSVFLMYLSWAQQASFSIA